MMLGSLVEYYEYLLEHHSEEVALPGWSSVRVAAFLDLDSEGNLVEIIPAQERGGVERKVPRRVERSSGVRANLLCDTASYLLGVDAKGNPKRALRCFDAARSLHEEALGGCEAGAARAVSAFFRNWRPEKAWENSALASNEELLLDGGNLAFMVDGREVLRDPEVKELVKIASTGIDGDETMVSLVSGEKVPIARLHPKIKGLVGAQSSGASLVSFNEPSFTSYGYDREQGLNAPVGEYEAFAYTTALNYLLSCPEHRIRIGDTTVVYWALRDDEECTRAFNLAMDPGSVLRPAWEDEGSPIEGEAEPEEDPDHLLDAIMEAVREGKKVGDERMGAPFFVLGLAPNAARVSVRFFLASTFGDVLSNVDAHYRRLQIAHAPFERKYLPPWRLVRETENPNAKQGAASGKLVDALLRAILTNGRYPAALFQHALMRIRATQDSDKAKKVDYGRAAIIRACLIRNYGYSEEDLTVELNTERRSVPYNLGRIFALLERVQEEAARLDGRKINATISDRYFNSACATPGVVFSTIEKLGMAHLAKLRKEGRSGWYERQLAELNEAVSRQAAHYPSRLSAEEQGDFVMGYWCQRQAFFEGKESKETVQED